MSTRCAEPSGLCLGCRSRRGAEWGSGSPGRECHAWPPQRAIIAPKLENTQQDAVGRGQVPPASLGDLRVVGRGAVPTVSPVPPRQAGERAAGPCRLGCPHMECCLCVGPGLTPHLHPGDPGQGEPGPAPLQATPEEALGQHCHTGTGGAQGPGTPVGVGSPGGCEDRAWAASAPAPGGRGIVPRARDSTALHLVPSGWVAVSWVPLGGSWGWAVLGGGGQGACGLHPRP